MEFEQKYVRGVRTIRQNQWKQNTTGSYGNKISLINTTPVWGARLIAGNKWAKIVAKESNNNRKPINIKYRLDLKQ